MWGQNTPQRHWEVEKCTLGGMCRRVQCKWCNKPSWAGCGAHVEAVLGDVPVDGRCACRFESRSPARANQAGASRSGRFARFFGR